ncbi:MAG: hypothetical protein ABSH21_12945 [Verrucomicrobiia bacterium]|jgi:hypothetical protein
MHIFHKKRTLARLKLLINENDDLRAGDAGLSEHERWVELVRSFLREMFGEQDSIYRQFCALDWGIGRDYSVAYGIDDTPSDAPLDVQMQAAYMSDLERAKGLLQAAERRIQARNFPMWYVREIWLQFNTLPALQLKIIIGAILIVALLAAGFTIREIVDLIKSLKKSD